MAGNARQYFVKVVVTSWMPGEKTYTMDDQEVFQTDDHKRVVQFGDELRSKAQDMHDADDWVPYDDD